MKNPLISIIIANYNGQLYLSACLDALLLSNYKKREIILVDDGSTDNSTVIIKEFQKKEESIILLKNEHNIGAAASRNKALKIARGKIVVFLDNDTAVSKNWLTRMVATLMSSPKIGACQSLLRDFEKKDLIQNAGMKLWAATGWGLPFHQWEKDRGQIKNNTEIIAVSAALGVKKDVCAKIGGFDEDEAVFTEDIDFSWRIWLAGYKVVVQPKSIVYHWTKSIDRRKNMKHSTQTVYYHLVKNSLMSILKNYELSNALKYFFVSVGINTGRSILVFLKRRDTSSFIGTLKGIVWIMGNIALILHKRSFVQKVRKSSDARLFGRVILQDSVANIYKIYFRQTGLL